MAEAKTAPFSLAINPVLNLAPYREIYRQHGIVQIPGVFAPETADALADMLARTVPWRLTFTENGQPVHYSRAEIEQIGPQAFQAKGRAIMEAARRNEGYLFNSYPMVEAILKGWDPGHPIHQVTEFLNGPEFLGLGRAATGEAGINKAEALASFYAPGHFLTRHLDKSEGERRAAYVIGLTKRWEPDWGGLLLFLDDKLDIARGYTPRFNVITIFDTRYVHTVTQVSTFAGAGRFSIAGWFRDDPIRQKR